MAKHGKNAKMEKLDLSLNIYVQYVEDFKFWVLAAGNAHRLSESDRENVREWSQARSIPERSRH